jgi:hypothetical protein
MLRAFGLSAFLTFVTLLASLVGFGPTAALTTLILIAIEVAFSFDNAIINAKVLERLSHFWQQLFLTVGMVFAIVGMRIVFPIVIVMITAGLGWSEVVNEALHNPHLYGEHLNEAHVAIASFGGAFLLLLAAYFLFDDARQILWLERLERQLQRFGGRVWLPPLLVALVVAVAAFFAGDEGAQILKAGFAGVATYTVLKLSIDGLGRLAGSDSTGQYVGWGAFLAFMYLQVLDASFSFDGVLGAFAITDNIVLIAMGLGVGAIWVRSLTVYIVRRGTLKEYKYLEHGAHYAILALAVALLTSIFVELPDAVTGLTGIGIIVASFLSSREAKQRKNFRNTPRR